MTWYQSLFELGKRVFSVESRLTKTEKELEALRRDFQRLYGFTKSVAEAVKRNQDKNEDAHERLVLELKNQLLQLQLDLMSSQLRQSAHNGSVAPQKVLSGSSELPSE